MQMKYRVQRFDLIKAYFYNLSHPSRTRLMVFGFSIALLVYLLLRAFLAGGGLLLSVLGLLLLQLLLLVSLLLSYLCLLPIQFLPR